MCPTAGENRRIHRDATVRRPTNRVTPPCVDDQSPHRLGAGGSGEPGVTWEGDGREVRYGRGGPIGRR
jgi:hypothetical protein